MSFSLYTNKDLMTRKIESMTNEEPAFQGTPSKSWSLQLQFSSIAKQTSKILRTEGVVNLSLSK